MKRLLVGSMMLAFVAACAPPPAKAPAPAASAAQSESDRLTTFLDAAYEQELMSSPEELTAQGRKELYDKLSDRSEAEQDRELEWRRKSVTDMKAQFDYAKLSDDAKDSFDMWALALESEDKSKPFRRHRYIFARGGAHTGIVNFLITQHKVESKADMEAYIARVGQIDDALDQLLVRAKAAATDGIRMPRFAYDQSLSEVKRVTTGAPFTAGDKSALYADASAKIAKLVADKKVSEDEGKALDVAAVKAMTGEMKPAYERLAAWLTEDRAKTTPDAKGAGALPNGVAYYNTALERQTTTKMTADEIHQLGLNEVARIHKEMEAIKAKVGFKGTLQQFFVHMRTNKKFILPNTDEGRAAYIKLAETDLAAMKAKMPQYFGILPKAGLVVKRVEPFREEPGGAQHYQTGSVDGSRPGTFYAHLSDMTAMPTYMLEGIAYHEGLPGHHMQLSIAQELTGLPKFRTQYSYGAYVEGWGLYCENLSKEMGFYEDPYSDFGRLSLEIWRAVRLVVDTGIHSKGWSEEQAVKYFLDNAPNPETAVRSEVRRYFVSPGQATTYKIGMIKIQSLRDEARTELGAKFDYRKFHDVVLGGGSLPLPVLEKRVKRWIAREKAS